MISMLRRVQRQPDDDVRVMGDGGARVDVLLT